MNSLHVDRVSGRVPGAEPQHDPQSADRLAPHERDGGAPRCGGVKHGAQKLTGRALGACVRTHPSAASIDAIVTPGHKGLQTTRGHHGGGHAGGGVYRSPGRGRGRGTQHGCGAPGGRRMPGVAKHGGNIRQPQKVASKTDNKNAPSVLPTAIPAIAPVESDIQNRVDRMADGGGEGATKRSDGNGTF